jgi:hypothetical protein
MIVSPLTRRGAWGMIEDGKVVPVGREEEL